MEPQQAAFLHKTLLIQIETERQITRKVLAAVPPGKGDYRPDPRSRTALELAWHIAASEIWFLDGIARGEFGAEEGAVPAEIKSSADIVAWYDKQFPARYDRVEKLSGEQVTRPVTFFTYNLPAVFYLLFLLKHSIHHRGQLACYLRPMGAKVPSIYGGSADEPFEAAAQARS